MVTLAWQRLALWLREVVLLPLVALLSAVLTPLCAGVSVHVVNCVYTVVWLNSEMAV